MVSYLAPSIVVSCVSPHVRKHKHANKHNLCNGEHHYKSAYIHIFDILLITETKLNDTFPEGQFCITGFLTFREDRDGKGVDFFSLTGTSSP